MQLIPLPEAEARHLTQRPFPCQGVQQPRQGDFPFARNQEIHLGAFPHHRFRAKAHLRPAQQDQAAGQRLTDFGEQGFYYPDVPDIAAEPQHLRLRGHQAVPQPVQGLIHRAFNDLDLMGQPGKGLHPRLQPPGGQGGVHILGVEGSQHHMQGYGLFF